MTLDQMWNRLAEHQPYADKKGYGKEWEALRMERTHNTAQAVGDYLWVNKHHYAAWAAWSAGWAMRDIAQAEMWTTKAEGQG